MPRQPRYFIPGYPQHVIARGVDRQPVFFQAADYQLYHSALTDAADTHGCLVHAYVLMTNHVHLLITPQQERALPLLMQAMGRNYVQRVNAMYDRTGTLWEGRYKASLVQDDYYLLACHRYIELNPVRAGMVSAPGDYMWSSYRHNAFGATDTLLTASTRYLALGHMPSARQRAYRSLFRDTLGDELVSRFRRNTNACTVIGNDRFKERIAALLGKPLPTGRRGRPKARNQ